MAFAEAATMSIVSLAFDRGSVVVHGLSRQADLAEIPGVFWDARVGAYRAPARLCYALAAELRRRSVSLTDQPLPKAVPPSGSRYPPLEPHQQVALGAWRLAGGRGVLSLPTGSARLELAVAAIGAARTPVLCLAPTPALAQRWRAVLEGHGFAVRCPDDRLRESDGVAPVTVACFGSAHRHLGRLGDRFGLLIADEVQQFGRGFPDEVLEMSTAPWRLGLTEGPLGPGPVRERIAALVGPDLFRLHPAEESNDYLPPFHRIAWSFTLDAGERRELRLATPQRAARLQVFPGCQQRALALLLDHHRRQKTLVFVPDEQTAQTVARAHQLPLLGRDAGPGQPSAIAEDFRKGRVPALMVVENAEAGGPGNLPDADVGVVLGGDAGDPAAGRRVGRRLRPAQSRRGLVYQLALEADARGARRSA
jgi:superfamily II DNA or RNA helicase